MFAKRLLAGLLVAGLVAVMVCPVLADPITFVNAPYDNTGTYQWTVVQGTDYMSAVTTTGPGADSPGVMMSSSTNQNGFAVVDTGNPFILSNGAVTISADVMQTASNAQLYEGVMLWASTDATWDGADNYYNWYHNDGVTNESYLRAVQRGTTGDLALNNLSLSIDYMLSGNDSAAASHYTPTYHDGETPPATYESKNFGGATEFTTFEANSWGHLVMTIDSTGKMIGNTYTWESDGDYTGSTPIATKQYDFVTAPTEVVGGIFFRDTSGTTQGYVTNLSISQIPEPGSLLMLGFGAIGIACWGLRRKKSDK